MSDPVSDADTIIALIGETAMSVAEAAMIAQYPFLGLPFVSQIWEFFLSQLESRVIAELQKSVNVVVIQITEDANAQAARDAADKLKQVQDAPIKDQAAIDKATDDFKNAYQALISMRASTPMP